MICCFSFVPDFPVYVVVEEDPEKLNLGGKSLDQCQDVVSDVEFATILKNIQNVLSNSDMKTMSPRQIEFVHLVETERNYTSILMMIVKVKKSVCCQIKCHVHKTKYKLELNYFLRTLKNRAKRTIKLVGEYWTCKK